MSIQIQCTTCIVPTIETMKRSDLPCKPEHYRCDECRKKLEVRCHGTCKKKFLISKESLKVAPKFYNCLDCLAKAGKIKYPCGECGCCKYMGPCEKGEGIICLA